MRSLSRGVFIHTKVVLGDRAAKIGGNTVKRPTRFFLAGRFLIRMVIMMKQAKQVSDFINSTIGLEVETHRINGKGELSHKAYTHGLLNERQHHFIKNDFLETQSELITPPTKTTLKGLKYLGVYHQALRSELAGNEYLWPYSMPPKLKADHSDIVIAQTDKESYEYRQQVAKIRKIERTAETGVHVNVGLTKKALKDLKVTDKETTDALYLQAAIGFMRYRWLLTYLFGATPVAFENYFSPETQAPKRPVRSLRNSHFGFGNGFISSYQSVQAYVDGILKAVDDQQLIAQREYYGTVRMKRNDDVRDLLTKGVAYIELRIYDLDPFEPLGVSENAVDLIRLMFAYFIHERPFKLDTADDDIDRAEKKNDQVALEDPLTVSQYHDEAVAFIEVLEQFSSQIVIPFNAQHLCFKLREMIDNPTLTPSGRLVSWLGEDPHRQFDQLLKFAKGYQDDLTHNPAIGFEALTAADQQEVMQTLKNGIPVRIKSWLK